MEKDSESQKEMKKENKGVERNESETEKTKPGSRSCQREKRASKYQLKTRNQFKR